MLAVLTNPSYARLFSAQVIALIGTVVGFVGSGLLVALTTFPPMAASDAAPFVDRLTRGVRVFMRSAELRALLAINVVVAACCSFVIVNTVVLVQSYLSRPEQDVAVLLAAYGLGSMGVALLVPRALGAVSDRPIMLAGSAVLALTRLAVAATLSASPEELSWTRLLILWAILGAATSALFTPGSAAAQRFNGAQPARGLCSPVRAIACLLPRDLPACRKSRGSDRIVVDGSDPRRNRRGCGSDRHRGVASGGYRPGRSTTSSRP